MATLARAAFPVFRASPVPLMGVLMTSFELAFCVGIVTLGVLSKEPETLTEALASAADEPDDPQPARTAQAASGTSRAAAKRRICFLSIDFGVIDVATSQPTATSRVHWVNNRPGCTERGASAGLHAGDELLHPLVDRAEWVLAQHGPLGLVVELQVHPVDGEIAPPLLRPADELAAQP